jgi:phenylpropionate dioxygenase-like ring-hydroxylating dioxygenase large terminal subunit
MFLKNAWYVAAWSEELTRTLMERVICAESVVMYRKENGEPVALGNTCPHRFAPLHMGKLVGDSIQCGYHGLRFGSAGQCVLNPHADGIISARMRVRSYPVQERHALIWLWFGDPADADANLIPDFSCHTDRGFRRIQGVFEVKAHYELITDNTLDLTHAEFVHDGLLSSDAITVSKLETTQKGTTVWSNRWCPNGAATPAWSAAFGGYRKPVDQWLYMRWDAPAHLLLDVGLTPVGCSRSEGIWMYGTDILTPRDAVTTYYFWAFSRNYKIEDATVDKFWHASVKLAFKGQDKPIIEAQQRMMGSRSLDEMGPVMIAADSAATRARRVLKKLIEDQGAGERARPGGVALRDLLFHGAPSREPVLPVV